MFFFPSFTRYCHLADCFTARYPNLEVDKETELKRYREFAEIIRPMVTETVSYVHDAICQGKNVLVEGANAAMLDIDFGMNFEFFPAFFSVLIKTTPTKATCT